MGCQHRQTQQHGRDYGYSCSVYTPGITDENPAAAGCITYTEECVGCGARRAVNANGCHHEYSDWHGSHAARRGKAAKLADLAAEAQRECASLSVSATHPDGRRLTVRIDREGYLCTEGAPHTDDDVREIVADAPHLLHAAQRLRSACVAADRAQKDVV